jgi:molybdopterin-binding protein
LTLDDGQIVTAVISRERAESLGLAPGDTATAFIAAPNILIGIPPGR